MIGYSFSCRSRFSIYRLFSALESYGLVNRIDCLHFAYFLIEKLFHWASFPWAASSSFQASCLFISSSSGILCFLSVSSLQSLYKRFSSFHTHQYRFFQQLREFLCRFPPKFQSERSFFHQLRSYSTWSCILRRAALCTTLSLWI